MPEVKRPHNMARNPTRQDDVIYASDVVSLAVSQHEKDLAFLQRMFDDAKWTLYKARTYREGMVELGRGRLHVTICECELPDGTWKDVISHLAPWSERPRLIVMSNHADERLWSEVLTMGGFDVLATPLKETEAAYAIGSAWLDWQHEHEHAQEHASMTVSR
jgi:DNA-binding NtrC family response regulator